MLCWSTCTYMYRKSQIHVIDRTILQGSRYLKSPPKNHKDFSEYFVMHGILWPFWPLTDRRFSYVNKPSSDVVINVFNKYVIRWYMTSMTVCKEITLLNRSRFFNFLTNDISSWTEDSLTSSDVITNVLDKYAVYRHQWQIAL